MNNHFQKTGDDSEQFILNVMNDIRYKPDNWSKQTAKRVMYGVGYHGILYTNSNEESYKRLCKNDENWWSSKDKRCK